MMLVKELLSQLNDKSLHAVFIAAAREKLHRIKVKTATKKGYYKWRSLQEERFDLQYLLDGEEIPNYTDDEWEELYGEAYK